MDKVKKASKKSRDKAPDTGSPQEQAERLARSLNQSAQQIWLAGVGAFGRAQAEGTKLFDGLVKEGANLEQTARKFAGSQAEVVRTVVESKVGQAREHAAGTWDKLESVFEGRVQQALARLGVPGRDDIAGLRRRVDTLSNEVRGQNGKAGTATDKAKKAGKTRKASAAKPAKPSPTPARKAAVAKTAPAPVKRAASKKVVAKKATRVTRPAAKKAPGRP